MPPDKKRSQRLKPVLDLANLNLDKAEAEMGRCRQLLQQEQGKLAGLIEYQTEYREMIHHGAGAPVAAHQPQMMQSFLKQLQTAIEQQRRHISSVEQQLTTVIASWKKRYGDTEAIGKVIDNAKVSEREEADRKQQNEMDDIAQMRFFSRDTNR
ncbi:MAG: flagellar export protein FliJ [Pseudomonadales bacterium]|nr:flagellar export protein FliJ [Pseudomonadales bacterium]